MFEIERKFRCPDALQARITSTAQLLGVTTFSDTYFDTASIDLTRADRWLRRRGGWELKLPLSGDGQNSNDDRIDRYREIADEEVIRATLGLPNRNGINLETALADAGCIPFCSLTTRRAKYRLRGIYTLDFDTVTAPGFFYQVAEVEVMVSDPDAIHEADTLLDNFIREYNIPQTRVSGKVIEYLRRHDPAHYAALVTAGVVKEAQT